MKIAMVCPYSLTVPGGVQGQVLGLSRALRDRGHSVQILAPSDGPPPDGSVTVIGQSILNESNGSMAPISPKPHAQLRTMRALWDETFDVIHLHEPLVPGPTITALLLHSAPIVGTFHAAGDQPMYKSMSGLAKWFATRIDAKVAVSPDAKALAASAIPEPWTTLFNGIDLEPFTDVEPHHVADRPAVLFVGRHEERKGLGVFLEAMSLIPDDIEVWIAGAGPETADLKRRYRDDPRMQWLGRISNVERNRRMAAASAFCVPSLGGESFGVILLEGMAAGAPVVASSISGYAAVAGPRDGEESAAMLTAPGDAAEMAAAVQSLLSSPEIANEYRARGRRRAASFSMERLAEAYTVIYEAVIAEARLSA